MDEMLNVKMPPEPPPQMIIEEKEVLEQPKREEEVEEPQEEEVVEDPRETIADEEVFKDAPQVKKVKRKASEKQLAHLKRMRDKKDANAQEKREFLADQKAKQKKVVEQERKRYPAKPKKVQYREELEEEVYYEPEQHQPQHQPQPHPHYGYETNDPHYEQQREQYYAEEEPQFALTPAQIKQLQRDAIMEYDGLRQQRKQAKQQQEVANHIKSQRQKVFAQMSGGASNDPNDPWANCFN